MASIASAGAMVGVIAAAGLFRCNSADEHADQREAQGSSSIPADEAESELRFAAWRELFDGETLDGWSETDFGGGSEVMVDDGRMILGFGEPLTGVNYTGEFPTEDYELEVAATRTAGTDFFIGLTFPVVDEHLTLIVGGWGGSLVGISSLDGEDASENETRQYHSFNPGEESSVRLRVQRGRLQVWLGEERIIDLGLEGRELSIRGEVELSKPMGLCSFTTVSAVRVVRIRELIE